MACCSYISLYSSQITTAATTWGDAYPMREEMTGFLVWLDANYVAGTSVTCSLYTSPVNDSNTANWTQVVAMTSVTEAVSPELKAVLSSTIPNLCQFVRAKIVTVGKSVDVTPDFRLLYEVVR